MTRSIQFIILIIIFFIPIAFQLQFLEVLKLKVFDSFVLEQEPSGFFTILNITESDIDKEGGYPLPRKRLAEIHIELLQAGAVGVGWVIGFPHPDRMGGDEQFAEALGYAPSVLPLFENDNGVYPNTTGTVILGESDVGGFMAYGALENISILKDTAMTEQGIATAPVDVDNLVRRIPLLYRTPDGWLASYGTQVLKALTGADTYVIKIGQNGLEEIKVKGIPAVPVDSLGRKWISWVDTPQTTLEEMDVEGKFVFIGTDASGIMPQLATPVGLLEPHRIQAALAESILIEDSPYIPDYALAVEALMYVTTVALMWLVLTFLGITWGLVLATTIMLSTAFGGLGMIRAGMLIDVSYTLIAQFITASVAFYLNFRQQYKLRQQIKKQFEHYLDPRQVKQLQKNPELLKLGGETRTATFLFTDVRGFTSMSESLPPEKVTYIMNKALTAQQLAVQEYGGMVDKYIGDAMMAIFNAPLDQDDHENKAIDAALKILENMKSLNLELTNEGLPSIAIGIGINTGTAVIGNMGSASRFDYTAIGDAVNTAARLESATKELGEDLLIGETTAKKSKYQLDLVKEIKVKGKANALKVYPYGL